MAYENYYTHADGDGQPAPRARYAWLKPAHSAWMAILGLRQRRTDLTLMYLNMMNPGTVLDVGCGNGRRLSSLRELGWSVQGQEVDPASATIASTTLGIPVFIGDLASAGFASESFDAVVCNHVIEHVHRPLPLLSEAYRILRPGGLLVFVTPNARSLGFRVFGPHWQGLDPPRHLRLYSSMSFRMLASGAGIESSQVWTTAAKAEAFADGSLLIRHKRKAGIHGNVRPGVLRLLGAMAFATFALFYHWLRPDSGEECVLWAQKPADAR